MIYSKRGEKAKELFLQGYNCSQSVAGAFADLSGIDFDTLMKLALPFGAGVGRMREVCGAFSGMLFAVGFVYGDSEHDARIKADVYRKVQQLAESFKTERGSLICREILGLKPNEGTEPDKISERTADFYKKRPCADACATAATVLEQFISEMNTGENLN